MNTSRQEFVDHYGAQYGLFSDNLLADIRKEAFGQDIGQTGWLSSDEQDAFIGILALDESTTLLDIACGSGRPTLRIAEKSGCCVVGLDVHIDAIESARKFAAENGLADRAAFRMGDGAAPLPFDGNSFDAVTCIDSINHLTDRSFVLSEWFRVLKPGGVLLFTDPVVITGSMTSEEINIRSSIGFFVYTPFGSNEDLLESTGFNLDTVFDGTGNVEANAKGWRKARHGRSAELIKKEGLKTFEGQQRFFLIAAKLADEKRLSRYIYVARKPEEELA